MSLRAFVEQKRMAKFLEHETRTRDNFVPFDFVCERLKNDIYLTEYDFNGTDRRRFESVISAMPAHNELSISWNDHYVVLWKDHYESLLKLEVELRYKDVIRGRVRPRRHSRLAKLVSHMANQLTPVHERLAELHLRTLESNGFGDVCGNSQQSKLQQLLNRYYLDSSEPNLRAYLVELEEVIDSLDSQRKHRPRLALDELETYLLMRNLLEEEL